MKNNMDQLEEQVLEKLLEGDDSVIAVLRYQLGLVKRKPRIMTGVGFFSKYELPSDAPRVQGNTSFRFGDVDAEIEGLQHGAGFVLFVDDGLMTMLEGYTYDEPWPIAFSIFNLSYMGHSHRDLQLLRGTAGWPAK